jgi:hypothetical protein
VRSGQVQVLADQVDKQQARFNIKRMRLPVNSH